MHFSAARFAAARNLEGGTRGGMRDSAVVVLVVNQVVQSGAGGFIGDCICRDGSLSFRMRRDGNVVANYSTDE